MTKKPRPTTKQLVPLYVAARRSEGLEPRTLEQLRYRLRDFAEVAPANPNRITRTHVEKWMDRPNLSPSYRRGRLSALRGFAVWAASRNHTTRDFTLGVKLPRVVEGVPKRLRPEEVTKLIDTVRHDKRTLLIVLLMLQEGLRRIEVSRLNVEDVDFTERSILVRGKGGQGQHTAALPISEETWGVLRAYLAEEPHRNGPLVRNRVRHHGRTAPSTISAIVAEAMIAAGVKAPGDSSRSPHSLRHTAAHDVLTRTDNVRAVQRALRHASVRSTEIYLRGHVGPDLREIMGGRQYDVREAVAALAAEGLLTDEETANVLARATTA